MFKEDIATCLPKRLTRKKQIAGQQSSPTKRLAKPTGKRKGRRPNRATQPTIGMSLQAEEKLKNNPTRATSEESSSSEDEDEEKPSTTSETSAPWPKRLNQKKTPPNALPTEPTRKPVRNRQSNLANALGNPELIDTKKKENKKKIQFISRSSHHRTKRRHPQS